MAKRFFIVRIELYDTNAEPNNYKTLYEEMEKEGFKETIMNVKGVEYDLPSGVYSKEEVCSKKLETADEVKTALDVVLKSAERAAFEAANNTNNYSILVVKSDAYTWVGLDKTEKN